MVSQRDPGTVQDVFGSDAEVYDARQYEAGYRTFIADRLDLASEALRGLALPVGARVLDVACGPGRLLAVTTSLGLAAVGIDGSPDMLRTARARVGPAAGLVRGNALGLPFRTEGFDAVTCSGLVEYFPDPLPLLREIRRVLRPGGRALVSSTNRLSPAHLLAPFTEPARRSAWLRTVLRRLGLPFGESSFRARTFRMYYHAPKQLARLLVEAGFERPELRYCHLQLLPHPIDRLTPAAATALLGVTDRFLAAGPLRLLAEGLLAVAVRPR
jgi:ubiquinone/menaquinone biosynthesis C-methylase UbiE